MNWTKQGLIIRDQAMARNGIFPLLVSFLLMCPQLALAQSKPSFGTFRSEEGWIVRLEGEPGGALEGVVIRPSSENSELEQFSIRAENARPRELTISYPSAQGAKEVVEYRRVDNLTEVINGNRLVYTRYRAKDEVSSLPNELLALIQASDIADESLVAPDFPTSGAISLPEAQAILAARNEAQLDYFGRVPVPDNLSESLVLVTNRDFATALQAGLSQEMRAQLRFYTKGQSKTLISFSAASIPFVVSQLQSAGVVSIGGEAFDRVFDSVRFSVSGKPPTFVRLFQTKKENPAVKLNALFKTIGAECDSRLDEQFGSIKIICDYHASDFALSASFGSEYWVRIGISLFPTDDSLVQGTVHSMEIFNATKERREVARRELQASKGKVIHPADQRVFWTRFKEALQKALNPEEQGEKS
ncbi:MAG: hypothetical protein MUE46_04885 [Xanthomonadales bacterium]|jgi:hypothetical protein|nr:hypothetical protein [Xanthomonadales bacterium]